MSGLWDRLAGLPGEPVDVWQRLAGYRSAPSIPATLVDNRPRLPQDASVVRVATDTAVADVVVVDDPPPDVDWPSLPDAIKHRALLDGQGAIRGMVDYLEGRRTARTAPVQRRPRLVREPGGGGRA